MPQNELTPCHLPSKATLRKYGLSLEEWLEIYRNQKGCCAICKQPFGEKRINTDHVHVKGWKKMRPENRKKYVRGLLCFTCNRFLVMKGVTKEKLEAAAEYLWGFGEAFKFLNSSTVVPGNEYLPLQSESKSK